MTPLEYAGLVAVCLLIVGRYAGGGTSRRDRP